MCNPSESREDVLRFVRPWADAGLLSSHEGLCRAVKPVILFTGGKVDDSRLAVGASKIGGAPDLTPNEKWPLTDDGIPLRFKLQINLSEICNLLPDSGLPASGLLSFFYDFMCDDGNRDEYVWGCETKDRDKWKVLYAPEVSSLVRSAFPHNLAKSPVENSAGLSGSFVSLTMANEKSLAIKDLNLSESESEIFSDVYYTQLSGAPDVLPVRLLGNAILIQHEYEEPCALLSQGEEWGPSERTVSREELLDWILLCEMDYSPQLGFDFPGEGSVYFFIKQSDLSRRVFDRVWVMMQSG